MKTQTYLKVWKPLLALFLLLAFIINLSCKSDQKKGNIGVTNEAAQKENTVNILTENMDFQMPDTITSGWNTFVYRNASAQTHFFLIDKYPEGITLDSVKTRVLPPFDSGMKLINEGNAEKGFAEFGKLPAWFMEMKNLGGSGLISPGYSAQTTLKLDQGYYIFECYVKMSNGMWHTSMGMTKEIIVSETNSGKTEPLADIKIEISSTEGIVFNDSIKSGNHTFSVYYKDQIIHENFIGHDLNLAKIEENADLDELNNWMDWSNPKGLIEPAPQGVTFLGGVNNMRTGDTGYFNVSLNPGKYVLIAEVPNPKEKNMLQTFEILK